MNLELKKRMISSFVIVLIFLFCLYIHKFTWLIFVISCCLLLWFEWIKMVKKIMFKNIIKKYLSYILSFLYLLYAGLIFYYVGLDTSLFILLASTCVCSDIGGYVFGKIIGGKKLTKISPNKTISGSIGSFVFSIIIFNLILYIYVDINYFKIETLILYLIIPFILSLINQLGDLFISYFKRKAKIKNTSELIPGHGGILDRFDGIIFAIPLVILLFILLSFFHPLYNL